MAGTLLVGLVGGCANLSQSTLIEANSKEISPIDSPWFSELAWANDGVRIAAISEESSGGISTAGNLFIINLEDKEFTQITNTRGDLYSHPDWARSDNLIATFSNRDPEGIWVFRPDGSGGYEMRGGDIPKWSPTHSLLAVLNIEEKNENNKTPVTMSLYDYDGNLVQTTELYTGNRIAYANMLWSPNGEQLAVIIAPTNPEGNVDDVYTLYLLSASGELVSEQPLDVLTCIDWIDTSNLLCLREKGSDKNKGIKFVRININGVCYQIGSDDSFLQSPRLSPSKEQLAYINHEGKVKLVDLAETSVIDLHVSTKLCD